jgi:hypothetical protein
MTLHEGGEQSQSEIDHDNRARPSLCMPLPHVGLAGIAFSWVHVLALHPRFPCYEQSIRYSHKTEKSENLGFSIFESSFFLLGLSFFVSNH